MNNRKRKKREKAEPPKQHHHYPPADWRDRFCAALANTANVRAACQAAGKNRAAVYRVRKEDPEFAARWKDALDDACDVLEAVARQRATAPAKASDLLLIFLLKAHRPDVYREKHEHTHSAPDGGPIEHKHTGKIDVLAKIEEYANEFADAGARQQIEDRGEAESRFSSNGNGKSVHPNGFHPPEP